MVGPLWYATAPMRLLGGIAVVRRQCGRRVKGAEAPQGGAAPPWEACGEGCGARPHKSGAKPAGAGALRFPDNAPDSRWLPWLLRPLGPSAAAESIREGVSPGTPILSRGWR